MKTKDLEVYQANSFVESRQSYTVNEKRLLSTIISFVKPTDMEFSEYEISIKDWAKMLKVSPKGLYQIADEITTELMLKIFAIKDPKTLKFKKWHVLDTAEYDDGIFKLKLDKKMNDIFLQLKESKKYTHYELMEFVSLTSTHAQRIYELLKQYQHSKNRKRPKMKITEVKKALGIEDKYKEYKAFRRNVLDIAEKQIHENTTLRYKWRATKRGRSFHEIEFYEIHIAGKESPSELQESAYLESYIGEEIYNKEFNTYLTIAQIEKNKDKTYTVIEKFDGARYEYSSNETLQESLAKAIIQKGLI
jgi:plasmid replication initiation protein